MKESDLRSFRSEIFYNIGVLINFVKVKGKHLYWSLLFVKIAGLGCNFISKEIPAQGYFYEFCKIFKNVFFEEHLRMAASEYCARFISISRN